MPYEDSIQRLLVLFLEYKQARNQRDRSRIELEILQLFDSLGASLTPAMLDVRGQFERMREEAALTVSPEKQLQRESHRFARERIALITRVPGAVKLSWGARELLRVPLIET